MLLVLKKTNKNYCLRSYNYCKGVWGYDLSSYSREQWKPPLVPVLIFYKGEISPNGEKNKKNSNW